MGSSGIAAPVMFGWVLLSLVCSLHNEMVTFMFRSSAIVSIFTLFLTVSYTFGQAPMLNGNAGKQPPQGSKGVLPVVVKMKERLNLTDDQVEKVDHLIRTSMPAPDQLRSLERAHVRNIMEAAKIETDRRIRALLDDKQKVVFDEIQAKAAMRRAKQAEERKEYMENDSVINLNKLMESKAKPPR